MAGKMCPKCGKMTFHISPTGRKCSKCDYEMTVRPNKGKGGKGTLCANCDEHKVWPDKNNKKKSKCAGCGATYE